MHFQIGNLATDIVPLTLGLEAIKSKCKEEWLTINIIQKIATDPNTMFVINGNDIAVLTFENGQLWIGQSWSDDGNALVKYMPDFIELAKECKCTCIGFDSLRPGWNKVLNKMGAKIKRTEYTIQL